MMWDNCTACEDKKREIEHMQDQLYSIRERVDYYSTQRDHWDWDNLIDDIMEILER